jgi:hypothetical protein
MYQPLRSNHFYEVPGHSEESPDDGNSDEFLPRKEPLKSHQTGALAIPSRGKTMTWAGSSPVHPTIEATYHPMARKPGRSAGPGGCQNALTPNRAADRRASAAYGSKVTLKPKANPYRMGAKTAACVSAPKVGALERALPLLEKTLS